MTSLIGYARVSTIDQDPELQHHALNEAGVIRTFTEHASGADPNRPQLAACLDYLREGDTLVVWKLDRLGRSLPHLIDVVTALGARGVAFRSLTEGFDTATPGGKLIFHLLGSLAEFERELIRERTLAGLARARANGRVGGRRPVLTGQKREQAFAMYDEQKLTVAQIAEVVGTSRATIYRALEARETAEATS